MTYYDVVKLLKANGWESIKLYNEQETWVKNGVAKTVTIQDVMSRSVVNDIIRSA